MARFCRSAFFLSAAFAADTEQRGWTDGNHNYVVDCNLLNPAQQNNIATGGDLCAALGGNNLNFGNANPNTTTINPAILGGWGVRPYDWQFGVSVQHELLPRPLVHEVLDYHRLAERF